MRMKAPKPKPTMKNGAVSDAATLIKPKPASPKNTTASLDAAIKEYRAMLGKFKHTSKVQGMTKIQVSDRLDQLLEQRKKMGK